MINRNSWGHSYSVVRGEILGFTEDEQLRKAACGVSRSETALSADLGGSSKYSNENFED